MNRVKFFYRDIEHEMYGNIHDIMVGSETYQIQSVELSDETFFVVKQSDEVVCVLQQNEKDEWEADCTLSEELLAEIMRVIKQLYQ